MKISIIVPVYNAERYLDKLVQSVLSQTYEDYELILVDDSSKDNSYSLMKKYQEMDSRIKAYTKENTGPGLTRKFGFEKSSGDLFFFVDSDDWITTSDVLREINDLFEKNEKIDVLFFDREDIIGDTKDIISGFNETREGLHNIDELNEVVRPGLGAKIFRKSILTEDMFYESTIFEDLYTTYIYLDKCSNFFYSAKCYYTIYHDIDSSSLSSKPTAESFAKSLEMILMVHEKLEKSSLRYSLELWMALLFTTYWKARVKNDTSYNSKMINDSIQKIAGILKEKLHLEEKENFIATRKGILDPNTLSKEERVKLIKEKPAYGNIICRCEMITEGEIIDAIHRPLGAKSLDGVKRRTRAGMGRCQAGFCSPRTMEILARELEIPMSEITKSGGKSRIIVGVNKEDI